MNTVDWPLYDPARPETLARYAIPEEVRRLVRLPQNTGADGRLAAIWDGLRRHGIGYARAREGSGPQGQAIRPPGEVLDKPGSGTCLDVALVLATACLNAGLPAAVMVLKPEVEGPLQHALVLASRTGAWPIGSGTEAWRELPDRFWEHVREDLEMPGRDLVVVDPVGLTQALGSRRVRGADADLATAARNAREYLLGGEWQLAAVVPIYAREDTHVPAPVPAIKPLKPIYMAPEDARSPLQRLRPEYQLTRFQDRDEFTILVDVCERAFQAGRSQLVVLHGVGGSGKTRLALEVAERMREQGWYAGVLVEHLGHPESWAWLTTIQAPLLVIVDYADARLDDAHRLFGSLRNRPGAPTVVMLTSRSDAGGWLQELSRALNAAGYPAPSHSLRLGDSLPHPERIYAALTSSKGRLPRPAPGVTWTTLDLVLLGWLDGDAAAEARGGQPMTREQLYGEVMSHELDYWVRAYEDISGVPSSQPDRDILTQAEALATLPRAHGRPDRDILAQAGALATLRQPQTTADLDRLLRAVDGLAEDAQWRNIVARSVATALGAHGHEPMAIRPDPVADYHLLTVLKQHEHLLQKALPADLPPDEALRAMWVLNRAGQWDEDAATRLIRGVIVSPSSPWQAAAMVANYATGPSRRALAELVGAQECPLPLDALSDAIDAFPTGARDLGLAIDERRLGGEEEPASRAKLLVRLSERQRAVGDRKKALVAIEEAVTRYRDLAEANPAAFTPDLAMSLNNLSNRRSEVGDRPGALAAIEEAVTLLRDLAGTNPAAFTPDLAGSLNNLSGCRSAVGDRSGALAAIEEAVTLRRDLAEANPAAFTPDLAGSLNNLSNRRSEVGDRPGALAAIEEAVTLRRDLARANPAAFTPDLAGSLNNLSGCRSAVGDRPGALAAIEEAVTLLRDLARANPAAFTPDLAGSLNNLSGCRSAVGDRSGALAAIEEAVTLRRDLARANPAAFTPDLAMSLNNLSNRRSEVGDRSGALAAIEEAVTLRRDLARANPAAFTPDLAGSLNNLSGCRSAVGDRSGALAAIEEAVTLRRDLARANPAAFTPDLAGSLNNLSVRRSEVGDRSGALAAIEEAVTLRRDLARANPAAFTPDLAMSLNNLSNRRSEVGDRSGALAAIEEAVTLLRDLARANPAAFTPDLAGSLNNLSNHRSAVGDRSGALAAIEEAVTLRRDLAEANPAAFTPDLAGSLNNLSVRRSAVGDRSGALAAIEEAVTLRRDLARANPAAFTPDLATSLNNLSNRRSEVGDRPGALAAIEEAVTRHRDLARANPAAFTPDLAMSLNNLSNHRSAVGDRPGALAAIEEAVTRYRDLAEANPAAFTPDLAGSLNNLSVRRSAVGDRSGALAAIEEAVTLRRDLARANPAAFTPDLAGSLNNLSVRRSEVGDRSGALAAIEEAVTLRRDLAEANPAAFTPDLSRSTTTLAGLHRDDEAALRIWQDSVAAVPGLFAALIGVAAAGWFHERKNTPAANAFLLGAAHAAESPHAATPAQVHEVRAMVRAAARSQETTLPGDLPPWVTDDIPAPVFDIANAWANASDLDEHVTVLHRHERTLVAADLDSGWSLLAFLYPGDPRLAALLELREHARSDGLEAVIARLQAQAHAAELVAGWLDTRTWGESIDYLREHFTVLTGPECRNLLTEHEDEVTRQHLAILDLATTEHAGNPDLPHLREILTDPTFATARALDALQAGNLGRSVAHLLANPQVMATPAAGPFLLATLLTLDGRAEDGLQVWRQANPTNIQRSALAIRLQGLLQHTPDPPTHQALARLLQEVEKPPATT